MVIGKPEKEKQIKMKVSAQEKKIIEALAKENGRSVGGECRHRVMESIQGELTLAKEVRSGIEGIQQTLDRLEIEIVDLIKH